MSVRRFSTLDAILLLNLPNLRWFASNDLNNVRSDVHIHSRKNIRNWPNFERTPLKSAR